MRGMGLILIVAGLLAAGTLCPAGETPAPPESSRDPARNGDAQDRNQQPPSARVKVALPSGIGQQAVVRPSGEAAPFDGDAESYRVYPAESFSTESSGVPSPVDAPAAETPDNRITVEPQPLVLARMDGKAITDRDVTRELWLRRGKETFDWMVGKAVLEHEMARLGVTVTEMEVEDRLAGHMDDLRRVFPAVGGHEDLARAVSGMGLDEYRERSVWVELALRKVMRETLKPTDEQLRVYFAERRAAYIEPDRTRISQIFIAPPPGPDGDIAGGTEERAEAERMIIEAHSRLRLGEDFLAVASSYASGAVTPRWVERGDLMRELEEAAFSLRPGAVSAPIRSAMGYHIVKVEERRDRKEPRFEDVRERVLEEYENRFFLAAAGEFMIRLKENAVREGRLTLAGEESLGKAGR